MGGRIGEFGRGGEGGVLVLNCISRFEISRGWHLCVFYIELNLVDFLLSRLSANSHSVGRIENLGYSHVNTSNGR